MFGKLDRYLARSFIEPFLVAAMVITGLYIVADAFDNLPKYLRQASGILEALSRIGQIYALRIPFFLAPVVPVATLIGAAFGISQLTAQNEINAMRASGLSYWRILSPIYAMAALAALLAIGNRELVVPRVEQIAAPNIQAWTGTEKQSHEDELVVDEIEKEQTKFTLYYDAARQRVTSFGSSRPCRAARRSPSPPGTRCRPVTAGCSMTSKARAPRCANASGARA